MGFFGYVSVIMKEPMGESKVRIYGQDDERRKYSISKPPPNRTKKTWSRWYVPTIVEMLRAPPPLPRTATDQIVNLEIVP